MFNNLFMESIITTYGAPTLCRKPTAEEAVRGYKEQPSVHPLQRQSLEKIIIIITARSKIPLIQVQLCKRQIQRNWEIKQVGSQSAGRGSE